MRRTDLNTHGWIGGILLASLTVWYFASWCLSGFKPAGGDVLLNILPYLILFIGLVICIIFCGKHAEWLILAVLFVWCIEESIFGLCQLAGFADSRHTIFRLTGHFQNPGPYGGFIACLMATALAVTVETSLPRTIRWLGAAALICGILVLPASMSRTAWIGFGAAGITVSFQNDRTRAFCKEHKLIIFLSAVLSIFFLAGLFLLKKESAVGRIQIWDMDLRTILRNPFFGVGPGYGQGAFGDTQEMYFTTHPEQMITWRGRAAGCPEFAFNDFLRIGMESGLPGLLLAIGVVLSAIKSLLGRRSPLAAGLTCWTVFACGSYPLSVPQLSALAVIFLADAIPGGAIRREGAVPAIISFSGLVLCICAGAVIASNSGTRENSDCRVLYAEGHRLFRNGRYEESLDYLSRGAELSSDPMFLIIMGRDYEALNDCESAKNMYERAHCRVPGRLYPMVRLMRLQIDRGENEMALQTAERIMQIEVNPRLLNMQRLHNETRAALDSLKSDMNYETD